MLWYLHYGHNWQKCDFGENTICYSDHGKVEQASLSVDLSEADSIIQHQLSLRNPCKASLLLTHRHARLQTRIHTHKKKNCRCKFLRLIKVHSPFPLVSHTHICCFFFFLREHERACTLIFVAFNSLRPC